MKLATVSDSLIISQHINWPLPPRVRKRLRYLLHAFFASVFNSQTGYSQGSQPSVLEDRNGEQNKPPIIQEEALNDLLSHLDTYKSMGPDDIHL